MKRLAPTPWRRLRSVCTPRRAAPNILPKAYIEGRRETRNGRERMGAAPLLPHMLSTLWSCCCRYLSASMPATHNLFFPQSDANSRKCMSPVDYDAPRIRRPRLHPRPRPSRRASAQRPKRPRGRTSVYGGRKTTGRASAADAADK